MYKLNIARSFGLLSIILLCSFIGADKNPGRKEEIKWLTLEEAAEKIKAEPRKVFVDVYTDWCGWCKKMDQSTFSDPAIAAYVNKHYYAVKLDAEGKEPITINGKTYQYNVKLRTHEAALALLNNKPGYPTTVYLDEKMAILSPVPGYLDVPTFKNILTYFAEDHFKKQSFEAFAAAANKK